MRGGIRTKIAWAIGLSVVVFSCCLSPYFWYRRSLRPDNPPERFQEGDLIGVWKADYRQYDWGLCGDNAVMRQARSLEEWLVLRENRTFYQVLQDRGGQIPDQWSQGTWWVERFPDGVTRLHLSKGRSFADEVCYHFPWLTPLKGWSSCCTSDQTGHELLYRYDEEAILIVGWDKFTREIYLEYPLVGSDLDAPIIVELERVPESEASSVPTSPEP